MSADARLAPDLRRRAALSEMAAAEIGTYRRLIRRLAQLGGDPYHAMAPFVAAIEAYHDETEPKDWLEALVKAYVGDGIADDFYGEVAALLDGDDRDLIMDVLHDGRYATFAAGRDPGRDRRRSAGSPARCRCGPAGWSARACRRRCASPRNGPRWSR